MKKLKNNYIMTIFALLSLFVAVVALVFAYFISKQKVSEKDVLFLDRKKDDLALVVDNTKVVYKDAWIFEETNMEVSMDDKADAERNYDIVVDFKNRSVRKVSLENNFILLNVTGPDGKEVTDIEGLNYVVTPDNSGFDVTGINGKFKLLSDCVINHESNNQNWKIKISYVAINRLIDYKVAFN